MTVSMDAGWYVVQTHINGEVKAASNLERQGFGVYFPRYLKRRSHARKVDMVVRPLFPRYLFVAKVAAQPWRSIQSTIGVSHLVSWGDNPASIRHDVIDSLKEREDERGFVRLEPRARFSPGDRVRVLAGALVDSLATVELNDRQRVGILLDFLGRKVRVFVEADLIEAA